MRSIRDVRFFKIIQSERGSVLLFSLAFGAMLAVVIMSLSSQMTSAMDNQKSRLLYNEYIEFVESIRSQLNDPFMCAALLQGQTFDGGSINDLVKSSNFSGLRTGFGANSTQMTSLPWQSKPGGNGIEIGQIRVMRDSFVNSSGVRAVAPAATMMMADPSNPTPYQIWRVVLTLIPNVPRVNINRDYLQIPLTLVMRGTSVQGCHGPNSSAAQCLAIGGAFDWRPSNGGGFAYPKNRCNPDLRSFYAQKLGPVTAEPLIIAADQASATTQCPPPYTAIPVGTFMDGQPRWLCRWQNNNRFPN